MKNANARIGKGKAVHSGHIDNTNSNGEHWWSSCGADHATNRGMVTYHLTSDEVTCKKCLKQQTKG